MKLAAPSSIELGSESGAAAGCITGVLCRIIRRDYVGRRCRDEEKAGEFASEQVKKNEQEKSAAVAVSPGIVARLMGLDSVSVYPFAPPEAISRALSVNAADELFREHRSRHGGQQLPKPQSFRKVPEYFRKENEEFFVLSFGDDGACEANAEQQNMNESRGKRKMIKNRRSGSSNLNNVAESKQCEGNSSVSPLKEIYGSAKAAKPSFTQGTMEAECSCQNSSPVSVLDLLLDADGECLTVNQFSSTEEEVSRKKLSSDIQKSSARSGTPKSGVQVAFRSQEDGNNKGRNFEHVAQDCSEIWPYICRRGEDVLKNKSWVVWELMKSEEVEEIGSVVEQEILDLLLQEVLVELSNYSDVVHENEKIKKISPLFSCYNHTLISLA